jgi:hypothetical protein
MDCSLKFTNKLVLRSPWLLATPAFAWFSWLEGNCFGLGCCCGLVELAAGGGWDMEGGLGWVVGVYEVVVLVYG